MLYEEPRGAIMPFGGDLLGHRGYALGLLVEAMATLLPGDDTDDIERVGNNLGFVVIDVDRQFRVRADRLAEYVLSSRPRGKAPVMLPGRIEQARRATAKDVVVDEVTWAAILERAERVRVEIPRPER